MLKTLAARFALISLLSAASASGGVAVPKTRPFSGPDYVYAGFDAIGAIAWLQAAVLFGVGTLDSYEDESDGHFARTLGGFAFQPIRIGTETILQMAAWRHYQSRKNWHALVAFAPAFTGWKAGTPPDSISAGAKEWSEGKGGLLYGFETRAPLGAEWMSHSRFLFGSKETGATRPHMTFQFGQGLSRPMELADGWRLVPQLALDFVWMDAHIGKEPGPYNTFHSTAFLAGPALGCEWLIGVFDLRLDYAIQAGPELQENRFYRDGLTGPNYENAFSVRNRLMAGAGFTF
jgi:hypothetical protein